MGCANTGSSSGIADGRLLAAATREAARDAVIGLWDTAVEDGTAIGPPAPSVVRVVRQAVESGTFTWLADAFGVLFAIVGCVGAWREASQVGGREQHGYETQLGWERSVLAELAGFDAVVREYLLDDEPEVRSMAALLLAWISTEPVTDLELLQLALDSEQVAAARGCLGEAVLRLGARTETWRGAVTRQERALALLEDESEQVRWRIAHYFAPRGDLANPGDGVAQVLARAVAVRAEAGSSALGRWPAEEL